MLIFFSSREFEFPGTRSSLDWYLSSVDTDSKKKLRSALRGVGYWEQAWRRVAVYSFASVHSVGEWPSQVPGQTCGPRELVNPATCSNIDDRLLLLRLTSAYVKNLQCCTYKKLPDMHQCICHDYIKQSAD